MYSLQMIRRAWDPELDILIEEVYRVKKAVEKQRMDDERRATFDIFLVRCLDLVINVCFREGLQLY